MNAGWEQLAEPAPRLMNAARARAGTRAIDARRIGVLGRKRTGEAAVTPCRADAAIERWLVVSWIGAHPDARDPLLAALWVLEEEARATGRPTLVLRLAPLIGPASPLLAQLARTPRLEGRLDRALVQPVLEADVIESLARWIDGSVEWAGWYELCGPDPMSAGELSRFARTGGFGAVAGVPAWEPGPGVLLEQGLSDWEPWARATGVVPRSVMPVSPGVSR